MCFLICFVEAQHFIKYQNNIKKYHDIFRVCRNRRDPDISQSVSKVAFFCYISCISYSCLRFKGFVYLNLYTFNHDCGPGGMPAICQSIHHCIFQRITDSACIGWIFGYVGHYSSMSRKYHDMLGTGAWYLENIMILFRKDQNLSENIMIFFSNLMGYCRISEESKNIMICFDLMVKY